MHIPTVPLILVASSFFLLALGQDPNKKHGVFACLLAGLAVFAYFAGITPSMLAATGH